LIDMKNLISLLLLAIVSCAALASENVNLRPADFDLTDNESLQRGAKHFVTYCLGCHSIKHIRYSRMAVDFGVDNKTVLKDIAPEGTSVYSQMHSAMNAHDAEKWFGIQPPDLSLVARSRGADWLYSYLTGFYVDQSKPLGVNNTVFKDVGMPNVLWQLQGEQMPVFKTIDGQKHIDRLVIKEPGKLSVQEFDLLVNDLVNFLVYVGEPMKLERERMGKYVLFFIAMFLLIAYLLKKEYWKDIH
jgi:ubiquinol-cytochrome c reductase cytochrome c1 subunit